MCKHDWIVYSTELSEGAIMVHCSRCRVEGKIVDPTEDEWSKAYYASSAPYRWNGGNERVKTNE